MNFQDLLKQMQRQGKLLGVFVLSFLIVAAHLSIGIDRTFARAANTMEYPTPPTTPAITNTNKLQFNKKQIALLKIAYKYGSEIGYPETIQAILLQESNAGTANIIGDLNEAVGRRSYGRMQIKVATVRLILPWYPDISKQYFNGRGATSILDEEIIALLLSNDDANIQIAARIFEFKLKESNNNWAKAVAAYNLGLAGAQRIRHYSKFPYVAAVSGSISGVINPLNEQLGLAAHTSTAEIKVATTK
jgi:hypothetical protein